MIGEEILHEIDATLDQLIQNAIAVETCSMNALDITEKEAFSKTQESLLAHLIHMDEKLVEKREKLKCLKKGSARLHIQEKLLKLEKLQEAQTNAISEELSIVKKHYRSHLRKSRFRKRVNR